MREKTVYTIHKIDREIEIGSSFNDSIWDKAEPTVWYKAEPTVWYKAGTLEQPVSKTEAGLLWSDNYIYVTYKAYDKDIFSYFTQRDSHTYFEDVLEFFFKTDPNNSPYYNFEINALNTVYDSYQPKQNFAGGDHRWSKWDSKGLKSAVLIDGEINNPKVIDNYWMLQMAIPFCDIEIAGKSKPDIHDMWAFMLSRYDYSVHLPDDGVELSATSVFDGSDFSFHMSQYWNYLRFDE